MAKIQDILEPWEGHKGEEVEAFIKDELSSKVEGVSVNGEPLQKGIDGSVDIPVPTIDKSLSLESDNAISNAVVTDSLNGVKAKTINEVRTRAVDGEGNQIDLVFYNENGDDFASVRIPTASEGGSSSYPKVTTTLLTPARMKLGGTMQVQWTYDHILVEDGTSSSSGTAAQTITIRAMVGTAEIYSDVLQNVAAGTGGTITLGPDVITMAGTVGVYVIAQVNYMEELQRTQGFKSANVVSMSLSSSLSPAERLTYGGWSDSAVNIEIPYSYSVPSGSTLDVWLDDDLYTTETIGNSGRNRILIQASSVGPGRHNVRMIAESDGLLSNAVFVDFLKQGGSADYIGVNVSFDVDSVEDLATMETDTIPVSVPLFDQLSISVGAWRRDSISSSVLVTVDGDEVQNLLLDRNIHTVRQRLDEEGTHEVVITNGSASITFQVSVVTAMAITEKEAPGYRKKLTSEGRTNMEDNRADWGGITTFSGVNWSTNGWNRGQDGVDALLLTNGATASIDIKPFVMDVTDGDYSIEAAGMELEFEVLVTQVTERGATIMHCLHDNRGNGYPMGLKMTTEEVGLFFGGVEEITTAEEIIIDGQVVPLVITRPSGITMNIAIDRWMHIAFVVKPSSQGRVAMLFINGVLSRANIYDGGLVQNVPKTITFDSDKADIRIRGLRYYRMPLESDEVLGNYIIDRPTPFEIQRKHMLNDVCNDTPDKDGNLTIDRDALLSKGRGVLTIIRSGDSGDGLADLFACTDKKENFKADVVRWEPPLDADGERIGQGFEARNVRIRIQGTSSVKYPYKNIRVYLTTAQDGERQLIIGGEDKTASAKGYALRGPSKSIEQSVLCAKTDFVDSSLVLNTGGAHLFDTTMRALGLETPPQEVDARVRQAIDGIPCDVYAAKSATGELTYYGQFVLNNEKSKSGAIFGMEDVDGFSPTLPIALETLTNSSPMTLFQPAGSADSNALEEQLAEEFDNGFEFNFPEDAVWSNVDEGQWDNAKGKWSVKPLVGARTAIKRWLGWIYDCVPSAMREAPEYGDRDGWSDISKAKWVSQKFKNEASQYFNVDHLLTYYLITDYWASVDQRAKNILWRTWDGEHWYSTYYDGDTAQSIRNDAFMVYLYNITRDSYDIERAKYAFEGHNSWLWCLVLANFEDELKACAATLRRQLTTSKMLDEFNDVMMGNWSERQYNKSGRLKYIDTIPTLNYVYTLTGNREMHRTQFLTDRARLLDARYGSGEYGNDVITFTVVRQSTDAVTSLSLISSDLYFFGYKLNNRWIQGPWECKAGDSLTLTFTDTLSTNDPLMLGGASCVRKIDLSLMGSQLNGNVGMSLCSAMEELYMPATNGASNVSITLGNTSKLKSVDITGQTGINTGTAGVFDVSKHTRLESFKAIGTDLTSIILPEGCPITELELPSSLTTLTLRHLPLLESNGLTLADATRITAFNFSDCPRLDWSVLLSMCVNVTHIRIEGISGILRSSELRPFMEGYSPTAADPTANMSYHGLREDGTEQGYPALIGEVQLYDVVEDFEVMRGFFEVCGLTVIPCQYSEYWFDDMNIDPANITNEDNQTGPAYYDPEIQDVAYQPNKYVRSGHVVRIHDMCEVVAGRISDVTGKMTLTRLDKTDFTKTANGDSFDLTDRYTQGYDIFLLVPHYWYKGVNDYKNARKHFFLSSNSALPISSSENVWRSTLLDTRYVTGKAISNPLMVVGDTFSDDLLVDAIVDSVHRIRVDGMKQVRFPSVNHPNFGCVFLDANNTILAAYNLNMESNTQTPADFINEAGDYDFRSIPEGAQWLYFTCFTSIPQTLEVIVTDSEELEAIEPDWVEHKPELIGIYQGSIDGITGSGGTPGTNCIGLRSLSGTSISRGDRTGVNPDWQYDAQGNPANIPTSNFNMSAMDFLNFANVRGEGYSAISYETQKDMANLFMAWFGTRSVEDIVGLGGRPNHQTGTRNSIAFGDTDKRGMNPASSNNDNQMNKIWGLEAWTGSTIEYVDNACLNAPSFSAFKRNLRNRDSSWAIDRVLNIVQQDGNERRVQGTTDTGNVCRVRFGRYCDIIPSSTYSDNTYSVGYANICGNGAPILLRSGHSARAEAGVTFWDGVPREHGSASFGTRLCYFGDLD